MKNMRMFAGHAQQDTLKRQTQVFKSSHCNILINFAPQSVLWWNEMHVSLALVCHSTELF